MKLFSGVLIVACLVLGLVACGGEESSSGGDGSTSSAAESAQIEALRLEKEKAELEAQTAQLEAQRDREAAKQAGAGSTAVEPEPEAKPQSVPDVVGLRLPRAEAALRAAGYETEAENTDTAFGIVVPSHYTVCEQAEPLGDVVTVLAQKYGC